jgi:urease accessory protein
MRSMLDLMFAATLIAMAEPALAHHVMGGQMPANAVQGFLSGLGHPIIGIDHFAAVIAIGFIAAVHGEGVRLIAGFVLAMIIGVAFHVVGVTVAASEILVAVSVIVLGAAIQLMPGIGVNTALALFATAGLINGYALGESIAGAQETPLIAYFAGLALIQFVVAFGAMKVANIVARETFTPMPLKLRLVSGVIIGIGLVFLVQNIRAAA